MERAARGLESFGLRVDVVLTSPLERALQTARIAVEALRPRPPLKILRPLAPGGGQGGVLAAISGLPPDASVMLVGHEPDLTELMVALLVDHRADFPIVFRKGGLARLDFDGTARRGGGRLVFHLPPKALRRMSRARPA